MLLKGDARTTFKLSPKAVLKEREEIE